MFVLHHVKKTFLLLGITTLASFLLIPSSLAKSGACSGHGGVNCSGGADSDGSVICMDGWEDSSVSYASMVMCSSYSPEPLPAPEPTPPPAREPEIFMETAAAPTPETATPAPSQEDSSSSPIPGVIVVGGVAWWAKKRFFKK